MTQVEGRQALGPEHHWQLKYMTDMCLAPDGASLAYVVERDDRAENERRAEIWLLALASGVATRFTAGTARDFAPRWSADGAQLAFLSTRNGGVPQLWVMPVDGGEPRRLTALRRGVAEPFWSADSAWLGFSAEVRPGEPPTGVALTVAAPADARERERQERDEAARPRVFTRQIYRWEGKGYLEGRTKLFRVWLADGRIEPLTDGDFDDAEPTCSPDGQWVAFVSDRSERRDANMATDLWLLNPATRDLRCLTDGHVVVLRPSWSPDGSRVAFLMAREVGAHSTYNTHLAVAEVASGAVVDLFTGLDRSTEVQVSSDLPSPSTSAPLWSRDGRALYCLAQRGGAVEVLRVEVLRAVPDRPGVATALGAGQASIKQIALAPDGEQLVLLRCDATSPWDLWSASLPAPAAPRRLTQVNADALAATQRAAPELLQFRAADGQEIEAWLYRPVVEGLAPLVLTVHGGPHSAYGFAFSLLAQSLVGRGYAVLQVNPRGSAGYGERFMQACDGDWGGADADDLLAGVDAALARGGLDGARLAVVGGSYGGYMTNWLVTRTERFRAAVSIYGIANLHSMFGTADMDVVWAQGDYGWPEENAAFYRERSPLTYVERVRTPIRIIGAEQDWRCPISQCEEWYTWLRRLDRAPVDFVRLPRASHTTFASPRQRVARLALTLEWIERYCPV